MPHAHRTDVGLITLMQPVLALELSTDGILLHQLSYDGVWRKIASASLSDPFLEKKMVAMRQAARASQGRFFENQVWIPSEHIKSFESKLTAEGPEERQIEAESIVSEHPDFQDGEYVVRYGEEDANGNSKIAAVNKSILTEADRFVTGYGFGTNSYTSAERINGFYEQPQFSIMNSPKVAINYGKIAFFGGIAILTASLFIVGYWIYNNLDFADDPSLAIEATAERILDLDEDPRAPIKPTNIASIDSSGSPENIVTESDSANFPAFDPSVGTFETLIDQQDLDSSLEIALPPNRATPLNIYSSYSLSQPPSTPTAADSLPAPEISGFPTIAAKSIVFTDTSSTSEISHGTPISRYELTNPAVSYVSSPRLADVLPKEESTVVLAAQLRKYNDNLGLYQVESSNAVLAELARISELQQIAPNIVTGSPEIVPYLRDGRNIAELPDDPEPTPATEKEVLFTTVVAPLTVEQLQRIPPRIYNERPEILPVLRNGIEIGAGLIEPTVVEGLSEEDQLDILVAIQEVAEQAEYRPLERPSTIEKIAVVNDPDLSEILVKSAKQPKFRRQGFAAYVEEIADAIAETARVTPTFDDSKRNVDLPTSANVARTATIKNGINLNETSLIGVFGKPGSFKALLRKRGGKYFTLTVGETIDGWTIIAIDETTVRLRKGGKTEVLRLPAEG